MSKFTPKSHYYRLGAVLAAALVAFLVIKSWAVPSDWVDTEGDWYRGGAVADNAEFPMSYGGNESCVECHKELHDEVAEATHKTLACESCHGALADHAKEGQKTADARVNMETDWDCLNCHDERITRPEGFPQFNKTKVEEHAQIEEGMPCTMCHSAHDPKP